MEEPATRAFPGSCKCRLLRRFHRWRPYRPGFHRRRRWRHHRRWRRFRTDRRSPREPPPAVATTAGVVRCREYRQVARLGVQVAEAVRYTATPRGFCTAISKPSNLLVDDRGNVWVADFGVAKTQGVAELTTAGELLGTIRYMAPERFAGECDPRSDVYSLGITLYEMAGQRPAYEASDRYDFIGQIRRSEPVPLRKLAPAVPRDLETIVQKAIDRDPAKRISNGRRLGR